MERGRIIGFGGTGKGGFGPDIGDSSPAAESPTTQGTSRGDDGKDRLKAPALLEVDRRVFSRLLLSPDCMSDHLPDTYMTYLQQL